MSTKAKLEAAIFTLLTARGQGKTICPSEAARAVGGEDWRSLMDATRAVAKELVSRGEIEITQHGEPIDINDSSVHGPIRLRLRDS